MPQLTFQQAMEQAVEHHRHGRLAQAEPLYRLVLKQHPNQPDALRLLGVLAVQAGQPDAGIELIRRAIAVDPGSRDAYAALGQALAGVGKLQESALAFEKAREIDPASPDLCNDLGNVLLGLGRFDEATALYQQALASRPQFPEALTNLAAVLMRQGKPELAIEACQRSLSIRPDFVEARANLGFALRQAGRFEEAIATLRGILRVHPRNADVQMNLAEALRQTGQLDESLAVARQTVAMFQNSPEAHNALGIILMSRRELQASIDSFRRAAELKPDFAEVFYNIGTALHDLGEEEQAVAEFEKALRLSPTMVQAWNNMGNTLLNLGRYTESAQAQRRAIELKADQASAHLNLAFALLSTGNLPEGFKEFEWRWQTQEVSLSKRRFTQPRWNGERLDGKTLLLHAEQGFGDTIQFVRYLPRVVESGAKIILACQSELSRLMSQIPGISQIVTEKDRLGPFDVHCALMSLPLVLGTTLETIPSKVPYLHAELEISQRWAERLKPYHDQMKIGLIWAGRPTHSHDRRRSMSLATLSPLGAVPNVTFFSLQKGDPAAQAANPPAGMNLVDWTPDLTDFTETAGLISNLDLIITVDTAAAHLAGALAKPVWVMLPFAPDWRWFLDRQDSPWYPTMRLFRQERMNEWSPVVEGVVGALGQMA